MFWGNRVIETEIQFRNISTIVWEAPLPHLAVIVQYLRTLRPNIDFAAVRLILQYDKYYIQAKLTVIVSYVHVGTRYVILTIMVELSGRSNILKS